MSLTRRHIDVEFKLGTGSFGQGGFDTVRVSGLRASATIQKAGGVTLSNITLKVYGLTLDLMNQLTTLGKPLVDGRRNTVSVFAYSGSDAPALMFRGIIQQAWSDMASVPESVFNVVAISGLLDALAPVAPTSFQGQADVATIMGGFAAQMGVPLENSGVSTQLANPYFSGTVTAQAQACARAANCELLIDDTVLAIWPKDGARIGDQALISPTTGMVGYPIWTQNGLVVKSLLNTVVRCGSYINVDSIIVPARGRWYVYSLSHVLEAEQPGGQWFTQMECSVLGHTIPIAR